ncbi:MAG: hypothetical protein HGB10_08750 [Coriobacteriia bacterium]|nr:hypothetical protein [Coriobacteriia bacterium]
MTQAAGMDRDRLLSKLRELDRAVELSFPGSVFELVIAGGGAMVLLGVITRPTEDIDALKFPKQLVSLMASFGMNGQIAAYGPNFPYNYEDRLVLVDFPFTALRCQTLALEDLVVSKLYSSRETDIDDIRQPAVLEAIDWERLAASVEEAKLSAMNDDRYHELLCAYDAYREECKP